MNLENKNLVSLALVIALLAFAYSVVSCASSYSRSIEPSSFRSFSVSAEGKVVAVPDVAKFTFSVVTEGGTGIGVLQEENTRKMNQAIQFVKDQGVEEKDIKTQRYSLEPRYQHYRCKEGDVCPPPEVVGYTIRQTAEVKIRDFESIGSIISGVVKSGANTVSRLSFAIDDPTEVENEARAKAIEKAKEKAQAIARAGGFKIGRLLSVKEKGEEPIYRYANEMAMDATDGMRGAEVPSVKPGSEEVTVGVILTYEIK